MIFPSETRTVDDMKVALCPNPCPRSCVECLGQCSFNKWGGHWWGVHNIDCPSCVEISNWRSARNITNSNVNSRIGPDATGKRQEYPIDPVSEEVMMATAKKLLALARALS